MSQARCHSPTSATDISDSSTQPRSLDSQARSFRRGDRLLAASPERFRPKHLEEHGVGPPFSNPAPGGTALDDAAQLQPDASPFSSLKKGRIGPRSRAMATSARRSQPRLKRKTRPLTPLFAPRERPGKPRSLTEGLGPLPPPLRQQERLSRLEAPFIDMCAAHFRRRRPPPTPRLCRRGPASGARSPNRCSRTKRLDPPRLRGLFTRGREDRAPLVDFCNQNDR